MRRVYRTTDKEIDIGRFFKQHAGDHGRAVALIAPLAVLAVFLKVILRVLDDLAHGDDAFGDKVESFDLRRGRNIGIEVIELCDDGLFEVLLIRTPKTPMELTNILSSMILKEEQSEYVYRFKTSRLTIHAEEPVDWVLDGEFGGAKTDVEIVNLQKRISIISGIKEIAADR